MVQLRISAAFIMLGAFATVSPLLIPARNAKELQVGKVLLSPAMGEELPPRVLPQATPNRNTQSNHHPPPPRVRDLGTAMCIILTTVDKTSFEHLQLRNPQERQRARILSNQPRPLSSVAPTQQTCPCISGRLMRMREKRQTDWQDQSRPQQSKQTNPQRRSQSQNSRVSPPASASLVPARIANNNNDIQNGRQRPHRISRLFDLHLQGAGKSSDVLQTAAPLPPAAPNTTLEPSQPSSEKGSGSKSSGTAPPSHQDGAQNGWDQYHPAEVVEDMAGIGERDLIADKDEEEL
ncbi:unnamed protein product [Rhizoctonia solani]|uniref:Uncharacterized protein n=1 Tax=Rhizoctonia solani TaxID=456999 RepID=A0A8H3CWA6_9AGAM|nr:unnamed protein product [Rhizoctonia solani]